MGFLVGPGVVGNAAMVPLAPCHSHVAARECVLCPGGDHGGLGDGYSCIKCKYLETFLLSHVDSQRLAQVNPCVEVSQVAIEIGLAYLRVCSRDVVEKRA
jgi:hypothetical protein